MEVPGQNIHEKNENEEVIRIENPSNDSEETANPIAAAWSLNFSRRPASLRRPCGSGPL